MADPVVTCNEGAVRFEGFSGCCGVYARVDLDERAFQGDLYRTGTTNVDFNNPMRAALTRLRDDEETRLAVGADEVVLSRGADSVVEKKVKLPIRWIKGFSPRLKPNSKFHHSRQNCRAYRVRVRPLDAPTFSRYYTPNILVFLQ